MGIQQTYSIEVDNTHVHVTDDFITHNTLQVATRILWELGNNHNLRIKVVSAKDASAEDILYLIRHSLMNNDRLHEVFPGLQLDPQAKVTQTDLNVKREVPQRDPSVKACGVTSSAAGGRADILVLDDAVDYNNAVKNPSMRPQILKTIRTIWMPLLSNNSRLWWLCTPYHQDDATHVLRRDGAFDQEWWKPAITYTIIYDENGDPKRDADGAVLQTKEILWPAWWSEALLEKQKAKIGLVAFTQQYLLKVISDEDLTFPPEVLMPSYDSMLWKLGQASPLPNELGLIPDFWPTYGGIDLASSLGIRGAFCVIWTLAKSPETGRLYFKEMVRKKLKFPQLLIEISNAFDRHKWQYALVENNAFQKAVETELDEKYKHIPMMGVHTGVNKNDAQIGLRGLANAFSKGLFALPARDAAVLGEDDTTPLGIFWNELTQHPGAQFSDTVMGLWFAYRAYLECDYDKYQNYGDCVEAS